MLTNCVSCGAEPRFKTNKRGDVCCYYCGRVVKVGPGTDMSEGCGYMFSSSGSSSDVYRIEEAGAVIILNRVDGG